MPAQGRCVPEPDASKSKGEDEIEPFQHQVLALSSGEENEEDVIDVPQMNGYEPLPAFEQLSMTSDEEEEDQGDTATHEKPEDRKLEVDFDLVRLAMKNIKIDASSIPPWAKELTDSAWNDVIKQTLDGKTTNKSSEQLPCSSASVQQVKDND